LLPGDGAIGNHSAAVQEAFIDFQILAQKLIKKMSEQPQLPLDT